MPVPDFATLTPVTQSGGAGPDFASLAPVTGQAGRGPDFDSLKPVEAAAPIQPPPGFSSWDNYEQARQGYTESQNSSDFIKSVGSDPLGFVKSLPADVAQTAETLGAHVLNTLAKVNRSGMPWDQKTLKVTTNKNGQESWSEGEPKPFKPGQPLWQPRGTVLQPEGSKLEQVISGLTTPGMLATFPFAETKPVQAYFLSQTAPGAINAAQKLFSKGGSSDERKAAATDLLLNSLMSFGLAKGLARARTPVPPPIATAPETIAPIPKPETFSEFGDDVASPAEAPIPAPITPAAAPDFETLRPMETPTPSGQTPVENVAPAPESNVKVLPQEAAKAEIPEWAQPSLEAGKDQPLPESADTLNHQLDAMREGQRPAVLFTPGEDVPQWAQDSDQFATHKTAAGTFLYDAAQVTRDQIDQAVKDNTVGALLGYGIDAKPKPADTVGAVVLRDGRGVEKQAVLTDQEHLPAVLRAAQQRAKPGDSVRLERPEDLIASRAAASAPQETPLTERQRLVQENIDAMAALRAAKESEEANAPTERNQPVYGEQEHPGIPPGPDVPAHPEEIRQAAGQRAGGGRGDERTAQELAAEAEARRLMLGERPPDIIDWIQDNHPRGVRTTSTADYGDYIKEATGAAREILSTKRGESADRVLQNMHEQGLYPRITTEDDLLEAINRAAEARKGWKSNKARPKTKAAYPEPANAPLQPFEKAPATGAYGQPPTVAPALRETATAGRLDNLAQRVHGKPYAELEDWQQQAVRQAVEARGVSNAGEASSPGGRPKAASGEPITAKPAGQLQPASPRPKNPQQSAQLKAAWFNKFLEGDTPDAVERTLDKAIAASRQRSLENQGKLFFRPDLGLSEPVYRMALQVIREAYARLRDLKGAIEEGINYLRANAPGFDEGRTRAEFQQDLAERATGQKIIASPAINEETKQAINQYIYERRSRQDAQMVADGLLAHYGLDAAMDIWRGAWPEVPADVRAKLIGSVARAMQAEARRDPAQAAGWARREGQWWNEVLPRNTELGQYISALDGVTEASPEGYVAKVRQEMDANAADELAGHATETTILRTALDEGRQDGLTAVKADPEVNDAARKAVDENILQSAQDIRSPIHQGIVMELAQPWSQSPAILAHAREAVHAKANELLNRAPRPAGFTPAQHLRQILDDLAQRAAGVFAGHIQGSEPGIPIVTKLQQRLGLDKAAAQKLATALSKEWDRQVDAARKGLDARLARQRARQLAGITAPDAADKPVDTLLRQALRNANLKLGQILGQEGARRTATGKHLADRVVDATGLTGDKAEALRAKLKSRYDELVRQAQQNKLDSLTKAAQQKAERSGAPTPLIRKKMERAFNQLVQLDRLAPVDGTQFYGVIKQVLGLPHLTEEGAAELRAAVQKAQAEPEGFLRQRAMIEVMKLEDRLAEAGKPWYTKPLSRGMAIFYANMLSGLTTYAKIPFENLNLFVAHTMLNWLTRPGELVHPVEYVKALAGAIKRGYAKGALQGLDTLRTGTLTGVYEQPKPPGPLENQPFGKRLEPLNFWKWFTRAIGTAHETTFKPAWEVKSTMVARAVARAEGLAGKQLDQRVADLLGNTQSRFEQAQAQAISELARTGNTSKADLARRTREIIEQGREEQMPGITRTARDYAQRVAYLNPSYGFLGAIGDNVVASIERLRSQFPMLGAGVKSQVPFVKVATNIVNEKLNWTPLGLYRGLLAQRTGRAYGRTLLDPNEIAELYAKGITGTIALAGLWQLRSHIHGAGPTSPAQEHQLAQTGWIPHSVEVNGKYYSYDNTPLMLPLAVIGAAEDFARYGKGDDAESATRAAYAIKGVIADIFSQGYLDSVGRLFEAVGNRNVATGAGQMEKVMARTGATFLVPNMLNQIDRMFDPTVRDQSDLAGLLQSQIPVLRHGNRPVLNALGEPVESPIFHHWFSEMKPDPLWQAVARQRAWIPEPSSRMIIGDKRLGPDYVRTITPAERYELLSKSGPMIRQALKEHLDDGGALDLNNLPPAAARKLVDAVAAKARAAALRQMQLQP